MSIPEVTFQPVGTEVYATVAIGDQEYYATGRTSADALCNLAASKELEEFGVVALMADGVRFNIRRDRP